MNNTTFTAGTRTGRCSTGRVARTLCLSLALVLGGAVAGMSPARAANDGLQFVNMEVDAARESPRACAVFDQSLSDVSPDAVRGYVRLTPAQDVAVTVEDTKLCVEGLSFGATYTLEVKPGVKAAESGDVLAAGVSRSVTIPDRTPTLAFRSGGVVLPSRSGAEGLPLRSVNVERAEVRILRINDRNMVRAVAEGMIRQPLYPAKIADLESGDGERVYSGILDIKAEKNKWVTTALPVADVTAPVKPGVYVATVRPAPASRKTEADAGTAEDADESSGWENLATQWFIISDIGLSAFKAEDGLTVVARSLAGTDALSKVSLTLYSRNNTPLATVRTDAQGVARVEPGLLRGEGGNAPLLLLAQSAEGNDFTFLSLEESRALDLTDRGDDGRQPDTGVAGGSLDVYAVTERGVYRPGETVHVTLLVRDRSLKAVDTVPLQVSLVRPDNVKVETRRLTTGGKAGGYTLDFTTTPQAMSGTWWVDVKADPARPPVGTATFLVEDFQPARLEVDLKPQKDALGPDGAGDIGLAARFLYGAPAAGLIAKSTADVRIASTPFPAFKDYRFGLVEEKLLPRAVPQEDVVTDEDGRAQVALALGALLPTTHPLEARVITDVVDVGGRTVSREAVLPIRNLPVALGVRVPSGGVADKSEAGVEIVALDADGQRIARKGVTWTLYRESYDFIWAMIDGSWRYDPVVSAVKVTEAKVDVGADAPARVAVPVDSGYYRFEVRDGENRQIASSARFTAGWWVDPDTVSQPDALPVTVKTTPSAVKPGEEVTVHIDPPYASQATVLAATRAVGSPQLLRLPAEGADIRVTAPLDSAGGFYVLVSAIQTPESGRAEAGRAEAARGGRTPLRRAMGVVWVPVETAPHRLSVTLEAPDLARPGEKMAAVVKVAESVAGGAAPPAEAYVTLAAVDDGVLQMTGYESPNPGDWFLGQKRIGVTVFDLYGDLIDASGALKGVLHDGADGEGVPRQLKGLPQPITRVVSLFSGIVPVEKGVARVPFTLPDFNGRLRLMAMAWTSGQVGQAERAVTVRAPLVADLLLPRVLAPEDRATVSLSLDNRDAPAGPYHVTLKADGPASLRAFQKAAKAPAAPADPPANSLTVTLKAGERVAVPLALAANGVGRALFTVEIAGPEGYRITRTFPLDVRAGNAVTTTRTTSLLPPGGKAEVAPALASFVPGTADVVWSVSPVPDVDLPFLLKDLFHYPYGCVEQTVSTALPFLYMGDLARSLGLVKDEAGARDRVTYALAKLADLQRADGGFSLWGPKDEDVSIWLSAYVADFLVRAADEKYVVPPATRTRVLEFLARSVRDFSGNTRDVTGVAYAHYILARANQADVGALRYFADTYGPTLPSTLARAQIAAALKRVGDDARLTTALANLTPPASIPVVPPQNRKNESDGSYYDYGTPLRDQAARLAVLAEEKLLEPARLLEMASELALPAAVPSAAPRHLFYSTQEESWLALAAHALGGVTGGTLHVRAGEEEIRTDRAVHRPLPGKTPKLTVTNLGDKPAYQTVTVSGVPLSPPPAEAKGFVLTRTYYRLDGTEVTDLSGVRQNDLLVVVLAGQTEEKYPQAVVVNDMLPAGFEIENARLTGSDRTESMAWLGEELSTPTATESRADRFVASLNLGEWWNQQTFKLAYIVRAVTVGTFAHPGAYVEDMYRPTRFARTASGRINVLAPDASAAAPVAPAPPASSPSSPSPSPKT